MQHTRCGIPHSRTLPLQAASKPGAIGGLLSVPLSVALGLATYSTQPLAGILPNGARTFLPIPKYPAIAWPTFRGGLYVSRALPRCPHPRRFQGRHRAPRCCAGRPHGDDPRPPSPPQSDRAAVAADKSGAGLCVAVRHRGIVSWWIQTKKCVASIARAIRPLNRAAARHGRPPCAGQNWYVRRSRRERG